MEPSETVAGSRVPNLPDSADGPFKHTSALDTDFADIRKTNLVTAQ
jgi:hypothetical protein